MIYRKQSNFESFKCIADKCPKSCCIGWQIMIDDEGLETYSRLGIEPKMSTEKRDFILRLKNSINYEDGSFIQHNIRCSMLNANGLCDLHSTLGEDFLCNTCRQYPRHTEEFQDIREYSLSLSCPEAVRMLLEPSYDFSICESEDGKLDVPEDYEDFDFLIFDKLEYARDKMFEIASDKKHPLATRMDIISKLGLRLQELYDEGDIFAMDDIYEDIDKLSHSDIEQTYRYCLESLDILISMEVLEESWRESMKNTKAYFRNSPDSLKLFTDTLYPEPTLEFIFEKILKSLLFTYFCGSVYDGQIYARTMIALQSVRWLMMINCACKGNSLNEVLYLYSREVEHSDNNVNTLIEYFEDEL